MIHKPGLSEAGSNLRLFTGIAAPDEINSRLDELIRQLRPIARVRWSPAANFHITTRFIGAWPQGRLEELKTALATLGTTGRVRIAIRGLGFFPNAKRPRIFWTGVDGGAPLVELASRTSQICVKLGVEPDEHSY